MTSFIYFDIGGVVIRDFNGTNKWSEVENEIGIKKEDSEAFMAFWDEHEGEICRGRDTEEVFALVKQKFNLKVDENYSILRDGFLKRLEINKSIWPAINIAKSKGKIGLLTNMYPGLLDLIFEKGIMPDIKWDAIVDSSIIGLAKPDFKIFKFAEGKAGFKGQEILFIENSKKNADSARKFGWQTFLYDPSNLEKSSMELENFLK